MDHAWSNMPSGATVTLGTVVANEASSGLVRMTQRLCQKYGHSFGFYQIFDQ